MQSFLKTGKLSKEEGGSKSTTTSKGVPDKLVPWVEKYRPRTVDDVVEQKEIVAVLKQVLQGADLPHFLFYGPPGTGKTSTIIAAARELFGDMYKARILELNASDDRGIQVIREKVKTFAQRTASNVRPDGKPCPPYKIIILDEADSMTHAAQAALRRTIEKETKTTRFCLICNYVSCIIEPLTSRCSKFRFKALGASKVQERLEEVCKAEGVTVAPGAVTALVETSGGDLRRAITSLQSCARLAAGTPITPEHVYDITGVIPSSWLTKLIDTCSLNDYCKMESLVESLLKEAYSASQLVEQLQQHIVSSDDFSDSKKSAVSEKLGLISWRLLDGSSEYLQLIELGCTLIKALQA